MSMGHRSSSSVVIARLDRAIHPSACGMPFDFPHGAMDCPVKPGNDGGWKGAGA